MKIVLAGGSGQVGTILARAFCADEKNEIVVLSRRAKNARWRFVAWDGSTLDEAWTREIDGADVVINLAGRSVNCRYTPENRKEILQSRVQSARAIGRAISEAKKPPRVWLQMSTATIYAHRFDAPNDEFFGIIGGNESNSPDTWRFSIEVAKAWEEAALEENIPDTRLVLLRAAMVMSPDEDGVFDTLLTLVRRGLGGRAGNGKQFMSWIHGADFVRAINWIIAHEDLGGAVNLSSPKPLSNAAFMLGLRRAWGAKIGLSANKLMIEIATRLMGTESELILKSRRVMPAKLLKSGFEFQFPDWTSAARDLTKACRGAKQ